MTSRALIGSTVLAAVGLCVGASAAAQQYGGRLQQFMHRAEERRANAPDDPNPTRITRPGDYRFSFVHDGLTREYLVHVPKSVPRPADAVAGGASRRRRRCRLPGRRFQVQADFQVRAGRLHRNVPQRLQPACERRLRHLERGQVLRRGAEGRRRRCRLHPRCNRPPGRSGGDRPTPHLRDRHVERRHDDVAAGLRSAGNPRHRAGRGHRQHALVQARAARSCDRVPRAGR